MSELPRLQAEPIPVESLAYSIPHRGGRPGIVTAIGVLSIVVACLSGFSSGLTAFYTGVFFAMSKALASVAVVPPPVPTTVPVSATPATPVTQPAVTTLTGAEINRIIAKVQRQTQNGLTSAQVATLRSELSSPVQQLVAPGTAWSPVRSASAMPGGNVMIQFTGGMIQLGTAGQVISQTSSSMAAMPNFGITGAAAAAVFLENVLSAILAVYLFVVGILMFGRSLQGAKLHRIYAWIKIPLALLSGPAAMWMGWQMISALSKSVAAGAPGPPFISFAMLAVGMSVLGYIYPVALLIALRSRSIREYYGSVQER